MTAWGATTTPASRPPVVGVRALTSLARNGLCVMRWVGGRILCFSAPATPRQSPDPYGCAEMLICQWLRWRGTARIFFGLVHAVTPGIEVDAAGAPSGNFASTSTCLMNESPI